ncbi:aldo/keto reductase [Nonomuraea sp. H19]|uniref:aldo/keto reductase n=1 Tax=Nonomuraea sp. H19 TaxID=3452206 RepID=UPI003F88A7C8
MGLPRSPHHILVNTYGGDPVRHRRLGRTGPVSSCVGLSLLGVREQLDPAAWVETLHYAIASGITLFDVSDLGASSELAPLIGKALATRRADLLLTASHPDTEEEGPGWLRRSCDDTLAQYDVDYIDIFFLRPGPATRIESSVAELAELVRHGKVRYIGLLGGSTAQLRRAHAIHPVTALATEYSLGHREAEMEQLPVARELGIGVVARCPFARGLLGGRVPDLSGFDPRESPGATGMLREAEAIAADLDIGMSRLALAWLLSRNDDVVPLPSALDPVQLEMDIAAAEVHLTPETCERLARVFSPPASA